jgi:hypothetical protein
MWSNDPESYVGGSLATGRASHTRKVNGDDPDKKRYPGPPSSGSDLRKSTSSREKKVVFKTSSSKMPQMGLREEWMCLLGEASLAPHVFGLAASKQRIHLYYLFIYLFL